MSIHVNLDVALEQFKKRKARNEKVKQVDNSSLPAGSPMYYYCRYCGASTDTMSESNWRRPILVCKPCEVLEAHGLV